MSQNTPTGIGWTVEYSTEVPPTAASTWNKVAGVIGVQLNPTAAPDIDVTDTDSTSEEVKTGLAGPGAASVTCVMDMTATGNQVEVYNLKGGAQRHWRFTAPKGVATSSSGMVHTMIATVQVASWGWSGVNSATGFAFDVRVNDDTPGITGEA